MDTKPTRQVLLKVPHNSRVAAFQDPNKTSRKPLMFSFQNQTSSQTVTPTCQLTPLFPQATLSLFHETNSISPDKPTSYSGSQTCSAPASPGTSWEPAPYSCPTCSAAAPCAAHLRCANAKKNGGQVLPRHCSRLATSPILAALPALSRFTVPCSWGSWATWPCSSAVPLLWDLRWRRSGEVLQPGASCSSATWAPKWKGGMAVTTLAAGVSLWLTYTVCQVFFSVRCMMASTSYCSWLNSLRCPEGWMKPGHSRHRVCFESRSNKRSHKRAKS